MKGETSGHTQTVKDIAFDCDGDTLLIQVDQIGAACHEGYQSCFFRSVEKDGQSFKITEPQLETPGANLRPEKIMEDAVTFAGRDYCLLLLLLVFARGMDFLSTWIATPNLVLEGNPLAKKLGWRRGLLLNLVLVGVLALWPLSAIVVATASVLVAARNFQSAWLMHSLGEDMYRQWHVERMQEARITVYLLCLAGTRC